MITKREFSAIDAQPAIIYGKQNGDSDRAYPILVTTLGTLAISSGMVIPVHDQQVIDETDPNNVSIAYKLSGSTKATKTIVKSGAITTISMTYA